MGPALRSSQGARRALRMTPRNDSYTLRPDHITILRLLDEAPTARRARWFVTRVEPRRSLRSWSRVLVGLRNAGLVDNVWIDPESSRWVITAEGQRALAAALPGTEAPS